MLIETISVGDMGVNCYIVADEKSREAMIIDPGADAANIKAILEKKKLKAKFIVNTHGHIDHIAANDQFGLPAWIHKDEADFLINPKKNLSAYFIAPKKFSAAAHLLEDKEKIKIGDISLSVIHTPGHTPGGICLAGAGVLFSGDTLFCGGVGRTDFPDGSEKELIDSIKKKIMILPDDTIVYPGHGPETTIGNERRSNPFL